MGAYWLHDALAPLQVAFGNKLKLLPGYTTRSRSTGGFDRISGIVNHHDADPPSGVDINAVNYCYFNAADRPVGNFHVVRNGDVYWGAAGASNHAGKGGPVTTSKGVIPLDLGNRYLIGIEASNSGIGEPWPDVQLESILKLDTVLCKVYKLNPLTDIYTHAGWCEPSCPGRKVDPAGPTPKYPKFGGLTGANTWNLGELRKEVNARVQAGIPVPTPNPGGHVLLYRVVPNDNWFAVCRKVFKDGQATGERVAALQAANPGNTTLNPGEIINIPGRVD
jgi:hypothetical protein